MDGARLGAALTSTENDLTLSEFAHLTDAFYLGGTKNGALFGEALVITRPELTRDFFRMKKRMGAVMEKGWLQGAQFLALLEDGLYFDMARHANQLAARLQEGIKALGLPLMAESSTNQIFPIVENGLRPKLEQVCAFEDWCPHDGTHTVIRFVTCFHTTQEDVDNLLSELKKLL